MTSNEKIKIIAIIGPTASGKTDTSLHLAEALDGEIISCDSMQIYKGMDIGTAKPTKAEQRGIVHHLFDVVEPSESFSCADYKILAEKALNDVISRGKTPIFCGGTGLYLDSVLGSGFSPSVPEGIRAELEKRDIDDLYDELCKIDPESALSIHKNNVKRVVRALEIYHGTGKTKSEWDRLSKLVQSKYDPLIIGLDYKDRQTLYNRINLRVDIMMKEGLLDEVKKVAPTLGYTASQAIGYKELVSYLNGNVTLEEAIELLKKNTRNYAKRQLTYFRRNANVRWFYPDVMTSEEIFENIVNIASKHLKSAQ